jgi:hypothetical protein
MGLMETQALLARLFTDAQARRAFFAAPEDFARRSGLNPEEAEAMARLDPEETEAFAASLLGKRVLDARKALPLTAKTLGKDFDRLLVEALQGPPAPERHRADAAALTGLLSSRVFDPPWIADLARYEMAFVSAARPGAVMILRRFAYPVDEIARQLVAGARPSVRPRRRLGLWLRAPGGRLLQRMF